MNRVCGKQGSWQMFYWFQLASITLQNGLQGNKNMSTCNYYTNSLANIFMEYDSFESFWLIP